MSNELQKLQNCIFQFILQELVHPFVCTDDINTQEVELKQIKLKGIPECS